MKLREARFKRRISQWELARRSKIHQSRISLIENDFPAKEDEKMKLAKGLGLRVSDITWPSL
jgi:transcriptional regulator with XRE-family HTH domain